MSIQLIQKYYTEIDKIIRYGGSRNESSLRKPFQDLLEGYARAKGLVLVAEVELESKKGTRIRPVQRVGRARGECHRLGVGSIPKEVQR